VGAEPAEPSVKGMKTIDKRGIEAVVAELKAKGVKL
jgi:large subunit ribosomal protein L28